MQSAPIPASLPYFDPEGIEFVLSRFRDILEGKSFLSQAQYCQQLEEAFAAYHGSRYAAAVSSGTAALEAMLRAVGVEGREVVVPANTFAATAFAVLAAGGIPVFADVGADLCLDPASAEHMISDRTRAILTVHVGGLVSGGIHALVDLCRRRGLALLEDACHAHGSSLAGRYAGTFGTAAAFSFFSTKVMTTGEGGLVMTDDEDVVRRIRTLRDQAKTKLGIYQNYHLERGFNWRMTEVQALLGLAQLHMLDAFVRRRSEIAALYRQELADALAAGGLALPPAPDEAQPNYYKLVFLLTRGDRAVLIKRMREEFGVSMGGFVYEIPLHRQPALASFAREGLPVAEDLCARHICPPIYYSMTDAQVVQVAAALRRCLPCE